MLSFYRSVVVPISGHHGLKIRVRAPRISAADKNRRTWKFIQRITGKGYCPMPPGFGTPGWAKKQRDARK
jgi:hypothetical protein